MRVLLTGATGFLGGHLAEAFVQRGHQVSAIVRPGSRTDLLRSLRIALHPAALDQPKNLLKAMRGADVVVHAAAKVHALGFWKDFVRATVTGTNNVLQAAITAGVPHFIHMSSVGVYGLPRQDGKPYSESDDPGRTYRWNYYSRAKAEAEKLVRNAQTHGLIATTIFRPTLVYGPRDSATFGGIVAALRSGRFKWIGTGDNLLSLVYVTDVANAVALAITDPQARNQIYNVAADELCATQRQFITWTCQSLDLLVPCAAISYRTAHLIGFACEGLSHLTCYQFHPPLTRLSVLLLGGRRGYNSRKLRAELGWRPNVSLKDGIQRCAEFYRNHATQHQSFDQ
jgi:nucleoside-diphosphate-sugar epimerase